MASPTDIAGLIRRWRADSIGQATGSAVASWPALTGGTALAQATGTAQPTYVTNAVGGKPVVRFDGTSDYLTATITGQAQPLTLSFVLKFNAIDPASWSATSGANVWDTGGAVQVLVGQGSQIDGYAGSDVFGSGVGITGYHVLTVIYNGAGSQVWWDGKQIGAGSAGTSALGTALAIGRASGSAVRFASMDLAEVNVYNSALTPGAKGQLGTLDAYYYQQYGINSADSASTDAGTTVAVNPLTPPPAPPTNRSVYFDATVAGSHTVLMRADILRAGKVIAQGLPISGGSVTGNRGQFARRTCTVVIADPAYIPTGSATDLLAPYGNEIRVWRGAVTPAGNELLCLGTFGIRSADFNDAGAFRGVTVTGIDRAKVLMESRFTVPRTIGPASAIATITTLVNEVLPNVAVRVDPDVWDVSIPQVSYPERRDQVIIDTLGAMGCEGFFSPMGEFVIQPIPSPNDPVKFTVNSGPGGVLVASQHNLSRDGVFNGVIARGSSTAAASNQPTSDLIVDSDVTSPTYWGGPFGQIVGFYDSSLLLDREQANNAAQALLLNQIGAARSINYSMLVNPAIEPGDVVAVVDPGTGAVEQHLQDQITYPLDVGSPMTAQTRSTLGVIRSPRKRRVQLYGGALS